MNPRQTRTDPKQGGKTLFVIVWAPTDTCGQFGSRVVSQAGHHGLASVSPSPAGSPVLSPRRGPRASQRSQPSPRAAVVEWGGCGEAAPCGGRGSSLAGGRPGGGGARGAAQGSHYPGVITQPNTARPLRQPAAEPGGAQQTPPGAASCPQLATLAPVSLSCHSLAPCLSFPQVNPNQRDYWRTKVFFSFFSFPIHPNLTDPGSSHMRTDPGVAQSIRSCVSALLPFSA